MAVGYYFCIFEQRASSFGINYIIKLGIYFLHYFRSLNLEDYKKKRGLIWNLNLEAPFTHIDLYKHRD